MTERDETEIIQQSPQTEMLLRENTTLKNWVLGILQGCEGCIEQAGQWAASMAVQEAHESPNGESHGEVV